MAPIAIARGPRVGRHAFRTHFDLTGRRVRTLYQGADLSGHYDARTVSELAWDGRDDAGAMVPPGLYLVSLFVDGDARQTRHARTVGVAY